MFSQAAFDQFIKELQGAIEGATQDSGEVEISFSTVRASSSAKTAKPKASKAIEKRQQKVLAKTFSKVKSSKENSLDEKRRVCWTEADYQKMLTGSFCGLSRHCLSM